MKKTPFIKSIPCAIEENRALVAALLQSGEAVTTGVHGNSMHPVIRNGDVVTIIPLNRADLQAGSIVLFHYARRLVLHRQITHDRHTGRCVLAGDMHRQETETVPFTACAGIAVRVTRNGRPRRIDSRVSRWAGLVRFHLRPVRRLLDAAKRALKRHCGMTVVHAATANPRHATESTERVK